MLKRYARILTSLVALIMPLSIFAVTDKEMEQARVIAAKAYIRYVNDGSGYLDELNPKTMDELEKSLKPKEKENLKPFKAIAVPKDYKNWDKQKLVDYWVNAFQDKSLQEKGRGGRIRARSQINKMTIAPPSSAAEPAAKPSAAETPAAANPQTEKPGNPEANANAEGMPDGMPTELLSGEEVALADQDGDDLQVNIEKEDNYTWVYIMILGILVAIVIALVVYASNVIKKNAEEQRRKVREAREDGESSSELKENFDAALADKDIEISMLTKKLESANRQNSELKAKLDSLVAEISSLRASLTSAKNSTLESSAQTVKEETPAKKINPLRSIYLGRANAKGIFVRADRTLNVGHSVFVLDTTDGFSGSFRVADSPAAWSLALSNPIEYLSAACMGNDLQDTEGYNKIVTEASGTAIFEGGCWKVIRKAKIRYE